jgi:hypothetical protein
MGQFLLKLDREHDAFVLFSSVVDGIVSDVMNRAEAFKVLLERRGGPEEMIEAAIVRAEISGTSAKQGDYGFNDGSILFLDGGACNKTVPRDQLYAYVMANGV